MRVREQIQEISSQSLRYPDHDGKLQIRLASFHFIQRGPRHLRHLAELRYRESLVASTAFDIDSEPGALLHETKADGWSPLIRICLLLRHA